jgi:pyruvate/2-oxoglutarate dehydrogenase complex dihydrolipoamide dehydrogenase (E3) component
MKSQSETWGFDRITADGPDYRPCGMVPVAIASCSANFQPQQQDEHSTMAKPPEARPDICVIGTDPAGIEIAFAAAGLGVPVMLVPNRRDHAAPVSASSPIPLALQKLRALGVGIIEGSGSFQDSSRFTVGDLTIRARRYVIATGAAPRFPAIAGIELPPVWEQNADGLPSSAHLLLVGGGAEGAAKAEAARQLGVKVTLLAEGALLDGFEPEMTDLLRVMFERKGIAVREHVRLTAATITPEGSNIFTMTFAESPGPISFTHLALACGAIPSIGDLGLEKAGIAVIGDTLRLSAALRTSNRRIYAVGTATGRDDAQRHAKAHSGTILGEILFRKKATLDPRLMSRLALTNPAIAEIGLRESEIKPGQTSRYRFYRASLLETGRHRGGKGKPTAGQIQPTAGQIKVIASPNGVIRGVSILAGDAAELIVPFTLAMTRGIPLHALAQLPIAAPSHAEAIGALARQALAERVRAPASLRLMRFLRIFG